MMFLAMTIGLCSRYSHELHFPDEETETQSGDLRSPRAQLPMQAVLTSELPT